MRRLMPLLLALCALAAPAVASAAEPTTLSVTGRGSVEVKPDQATIGLGVRKVSPTQEGARGTVNRRTRQIITSLTRLGVDREDLQSTGVTLSEQRLRPLKKGGRARVRYTATDSLTVRTDELELVGRIFDAATAAGATDFSGPNFTVENRSPARADATAAAVADARRRAESAAASLGLRVVGVQSVVLDPGAGTATPTDGAATVPGASPGTASPPPTQVAPGIEVVAAVAQVTFFLG